MDGELSFRLLGGLAARVGPGTAGAELDLGGPQPRRLLAALLLTLDHPLSPERLIELVWGQAPPASARGSLQAHISNLRRELEPHRRPGAPSQVIALRPGGYQLVIDAAQLDVGGFERAVEGGIAAAQEGRPAAAVAILVDALAGWAPLLPELSDLPFVRAEAERLEARRQTAFELLQAARVDIGAHHDAIADLRRALAEDPRAERLWGLLALARYRAGQPAEAIATLHQARDALREATGLDLGAELRQLEADLYAQAPTLDAPPNPGRSRGRAPESPAPPRPPCRRPTRTRPGSCGGAHLRRW